eukprot:6174247-Pleurochrysis_carterae.AAC.3
MPTHNAAHCRVPGVSNAIDRRALFLHVAAACAPFCMQPTNPAQAIVNGESVTDAEVRTLRAAHSLARGTLQHLKKAVGTSTRALSSGVWRAHLVSAWT